MPMQRARGQGRPRELVALGEEVLFQPMTKYATVDKLDARWHRGAFLGVNFRTNEVVLGNADDGTMVEAWYGVSQERRMCASPSARRATRRTTG